ncbi:winged helix-turn-helix transcriptional regulator [Deinococcus sp.]|uniref:winged helix-turn-helix transcriptional regulator n=1 Tax=Deinococcus sp. TaxID=47478 RepID=UPI003CC6CB34
MTVTTQPASVLNANCASRRVLDLLSDKWTTLVLRALESGTQRFGVLKRRIDGISQKMLTQTLRRLEAAGLISRAVQHVVPPVVEYSLTPLGRSLLPALDALVSWAEKNYTEVEAAWSRVDLA